jgi:hypothetical protein
MVPLKTLNFENKIENWEVLEVNQNYGVTHVTLHCGHSYLP